MSLGVVIILITALGYVSNHLNWRFLNYKPVQLLYYIGAFVHEASHALLCLLTGAKIEEFKIFSNQPHVVYRKSRLPILGGALISFAPVAGGLFFLYAVNAYLLGNYFAVPQFSGIPSLLTEPLRLLSQVDLLHWQSWIMLLLSFNTGAMIGPSTRDLKNVWLVILVLLFVQSAFFANLGLLAASLILVNILIQVIFILAFGILKGVRILHLL